MARGLESVFRLSEYDDFMRRMSCITSYPIPETTMPMEEAREVLGRFFSLPETISTVK